MIKVKIPFWMRMQNFIIYPNESIFWTSASLSPWQRFKKWISKDSSAMCNTSTGKTLPFHGQWLLYEDGNIIFDNGHFRTTFSPNLELLNEEKSNRLTASDIYKLPMTDDLGVLQGVEYDGNRLYAVFGSTGVLPITIRMYADKPLAFKSWRILNFSTYKKWWMKNWEAEGIRKVGNKLFIGICFKTYFFTKVNYLIEVE